jgi:hypothetical protein
MTWYVSWAPTPSNGRLGDVFIGPNSIIVVGGKAAPSATHRTVRWWAPDSPTPCLLAVGSVSRPLVLSAFALDSPDPPQQCHQELAVGLLFPGTPDSPTCGTGQSASDNIFLRFLGFA